MRPCFQSLLERSDIIVHSILSCSSCSEVLHSKATCKEWMSVLESVMMQQVNLFVTSSFDSVHLHKEAHGASNQMDIRLQELLRSHGLQDLTPESSIYSWYRAQLHIQLLVERSPTITLRNMIQRCFECSNAVGTNRFEFAQLKSHLQHRLQCEDQLWNATMDSQLFREGGLVRQRDMGCDTLGKSVLQVLTVVSMLLRREKNTGSYCEKFCRCFK